MFKQVDQTQLDIKQKSESKSTADLVLKDRVKTMVNLVKMKEILSSDQNFNTLKLDNITTQVNPNTKEGQEILSKVTEAMSELKAANNLNYETLNEKMENQGIRIDLSEQRLNEIDAKLQD